jgi:hypothetical protein
VWKCCVTGYEVRWRVVALVRRVVWRIRARRCCVLDGILGALVEWYCACACACAAAWGSERRAPARRRGAFEKRVCDIVGVVVVGGSWG